MVHNDHTPLIPLVYDTVNVTVGGNATGNATVVGLSAKDIAFNVSTITVPAGANVTVHFTNEDSGIPHNFAVYTDSCDREDLLRRDHHRPGDNHLQLHRTRQTRHLLLPRDVHPCR